MAGIYQVWDRGLIDYQLWELEGLRLRGPLRTKQKFISFLGAAQTFGRFCAKPFPAIVAERLDLADMNFGVGGKGPSFFANSATVIDCVNRSSIAVVQVMSGRSVSNSEFTTKDGGRDGVRNSDGRPMAAEDFYKERLRPLGAKKRAAASLETLFEETRKNYFLEMVRLLGLIRVPKILFWFSVRRPDEKTVREINLHGCVDRIKGFASRINATSRFERLGGAFPHLVDRNTLHELLPYCDDYVECVTSRGLPKVCFDKQRFRPVWNNYYPSPGMHHEAAEALIPACQRLLHPFRARSTH